MSRSAYLTVGDTEKINTCLDSAPIIRGTLQGEIPENRQIIRKFPVTKHKIQ